MHTLYLSPYGRDTWTGNFATPTPDGKDGPLRTLGGARFRLRTLRSAGAIAGQAQVMLTDGIYPMDKPLILEPEDSLITFSPAPGANPIIEGGRRISDWEETTVNGTPCWSVHLPDVEDGEWYFRSLFVNGIRRKRPLWPKDGLMDMERVPSIKENSKLTDGSNSFYCAPQDASVFENITNLQDAEVVVFHYWVEERMPIESYNPDTRFVKCTRRSVFELMDDWTRKFARYKLENVFEVMTEPGEWYLNRTTGMLYYIPMPGETMENTEIWAPTCSCLVQVMGEPEREKYVHGISFEGLVFRHTDWYMPTEGYIRSGLNQTIYHSKGVPPYINYRDRWNDYFNESEDFCVPVSELAAAQQAAFIFPGTVQFRGARGCAVRDCTFTQMGLFGISTEEGTWGMEIVHNTFTELGAGAIKMGGADFFEDPLLRNGCNIFTDNHVFNCGQVFLAAPGVVSLHSAKNTLSHNHIHDCPYSGISCGWVWGYDPSISTDNHIDYNHIHDLGMGLMSDMGGIYTLGVQPGTTVRGNVIHDVHRKNYGGWGVYHDEGSSHIVSECNVCWNCDSNAFHTHYGRELIIRNNIFAFGGEGTIYVTRKEDHRTMTFERNIVISNGKEFFRGAAADNDVALSDLNLLWDISEGASEAKQKEFAQLQEKGTNLHSCMMDPLFKDAAAFDFTLAEDSPAYKLGFQPIDMSKAGIREKT